MVAIFSSGIPRAAQSDASCGVDATPAHCPMAFSADSPMVMKNSQDRLDLSGSIFYIRPRTIPSFFMRNCRVGRLTPKRVAATLWSGKKPLGLFQSRQNVRVFGLFQRLVLFLAQGSGDHRVSHVQA